ncbi:MAG: enoyl-CoA hydratase/isomerase family protein [Thermincolia bacterium]
MGGKLYYRELSRITIVTIKRPTAHNAMTCEMWRQLRDIGKSISKNSNTRVVIIRGAFNYFTSGSDIKEFQNLDVNELDEAFALMEEAISTFERLPIPTIACIKGSAMGAGLQLALGCDLRVAATNAKLGMPIGRLGITLGMPFARRLVDLIGPSRTKDLLFTGRVIKADEAFQLGMVNYLTEAKVEDFALRLAKTIANQSPASNRASKEAVAHCIARTDVPLRGRPYPYFVDAHEFREGVDAFIEKRAPNFRVIKGEMT